MVKKKINRLKIVLAEQNRTNKWLAERLGKNITTISRWCTDEAQPSVETLIKIAEILEIDVRDLLNPTKTKKS